MERIADIISFCCLGMITWQDLRTRFVSWWLFPLLFLVAFVPVFARGDLYENMASILYNLLFIVLLFGSTYLYFLLKKGSAHSFLDECVGTGDLLFLIAITPLFSPANFILFCTGGFILTLFTAVLVRFTRPGYWAHIPLAGAMAVGLAVMVATGLIDPPFSLHNENWLNSLPVMF